MSDMSEFETDVWDFEPVILKFKHGKTKLFKIKLEQRLETH